MAVYFAVAKNDDNVFNAYIYPFLEYFNLKCCIATDEVDGQVESIFVKYNAAIDQYKRDGLNPDDVLVFCHEDVKLIDPEFVTKIDMTFKEKQDVGLVGVVGANSISENGGWWQNPAHSMRGHIVQEHGEKCNHLVKGPVGYFDDLVAVDGVCFGIRASLINDGLMFDQSFDGFDFYDIDICLKVLEMGYKVACIDALIQHKSIGDVSNKSGWFANRDKLVKKWNEKGYKFPLTSGTFLSKENVEEIEV